MTTAAESPPTLRQIPLPPQFVSRLHRADLEKQVREDLPGWAIKYIQEKEPPKYAMIVEPIIHDGVLLDSANNRMEHTIPEGELPAKIRPNEAEKIEGTITVGVFEGWEMVDFNPYARYVKIAKLDPGVSRTRKEAALTLGVHPAEIKVRMVIAPDDHTLIRYDLQLPDTYQRHKHFGQSILTIPNATKHPGGLWAVAEDVVGDVGWRVVDDSFEKTAALIAGERPTFDPVIPYPFEGWDLDDWATIPCGPRLDGGYAVWNVASNSHAMWSGGSNSGKTTSLIFGPITGTLLRGYQVAIVDPEKYGNDYRRLRPYLAEGFGWGCDDLMQAYTAMKLIDEEAKRRLELTKKYEVGNIADLPPGEQPPRILVVVDEVSQLFTWPKEKDVLPGDVDAMQAAIIKPQIAVIIGRITQKYRSVGVHLVMAGQKQSGDVFVPIKANVPTRALLGPNPNQTARLAALNDSKSVPTPPGYIRDDPDVARGVGVFETDGDSPSVFKSFFVPIEVLLDELSKAKVPQRDQNACLPSPADMERFDPFANADDDDMEEGDIDVSGLTKDARSTTEVAKELFGGECPACGKPILDGRCACGE